MLSTEIQSFYNADVGEIRGFIDKSGEPWFLAGQICRELGIKDAGQAVQQVKDRLAIAEYKGSFSKSILVDTGGGKQRSIIIPEPYLYELIFASRKKKAIKFRAWVTTEVLPDLRKHGEYRMTGKLIRRSLTDEIKESGENERMHGHAYSQYSLLINKSLGLDSKVDRDSLPPEILEKIAQRENTVQALIREGAIYSKVKEVIEGFQN